MASYATSNARRDVINLCATKAEVEAIVKLLNRETLVNNQERAAAERLQSAMEASVSTSARRAGFYDL